MTERDFEQRLRDEFRQMVNEAAPSALRASVIAIPDVLSPTPERRLTARWRFPSLNRFASFALAATAVVIAILIGIGLVLRLPPSVGPSPIPGPTHQATPKPTSTPLAGPLGGGLILVHEAYDPSHPSNPAPLNVFTLDAGTGQETLLGTVQPSGGQDETGNRYDFQWGADRKHVLLTQFNGGGITALDNATGAARELSFVCCEPPAEVIQLPPEQQLPGKTQYRQQRGYDWVLSPQSDRIAGLHDGQIHTPGCLLCSAPEAIVILDVDGGNLRTLPLPAGTYGNGPISWSPDGSAVVISGCRPCNDPYSPGVADKTPTAVQHGHLFIVPVDGSAVRELLDEKETTLYSAAWSPDGTTIAFGRYECPADEHAPYCQRGTHGLMTMTVADGQDNVVAEAFSDHLVWSPDARRIAFDGIVVIDADGSHLTSLSGGQQPRWSPDGQWLLFSIYDAAQRMTRPWIVSAGGGEARPLGPYGGYAW